MSAVLTSVKHVQLRASLGAQGKRHEQYYAYGEGHFPQCENGNVPIAHVFDQNSSQTGTTRTVAESVTVEPSKPSQTST